MEVARAQREEAVVARQEAEAALRNAKKEMEAQELVNPRDDFSHFPSPLPVSLSTHSLPTPPLFPPLSLYPPFSSLQSMALLQKKLSSVEEELCEVRASLEEETGRQGEWREGRDHLQVDLKAAEKRVEAARAEVEKEKELR